MTDRAAATDAIAALEDLDDDQSFVLLTGGQNGLNCLLDAGDHEPQGTHLHLLATHAQALADALNITVGDVLQAGHQAHQTMTESGAAAVTLDLSEEARS